ncbi:MAG TPA: DUF6541 family protein [Candidatus Nanoarchaeia archaeon]|nr:DUF6541 family protein [Candidatus Nanoarchaeia archaeon]
MKQLLKNLKTEYVILALIFLFTLAFRLYFSFQTNHFNTDDAYFHLRHIEYILENKSIMFFDDLSYGGRIVLYPPFFHILMALLTFGSTFMLKLIPALAISSVVIIVYLISRDMCLSKRGAMIAALLSGFYPILFNLTLNNISVYTFVIPLILLLIYSLTRLDDKKYLWIYIIGSFLLPLIHASAFIFIISLVLYFFLIAGGALLPTKIKKEAALFSILITVLLQFIIYKKVILEYGLSLISQSIPVNVLSDLYGELSFSDLFIGIGFLPLILGSLGFYVSAIKEKRKIAYLFAAFGLTVLMLIFFRFLSIKVGLMFIGLVLAIFSGSGYTLIRDYFYRIKFSSLNKYFIILILLLLFFTSLIPSYYGAKESNNIAISNIKEMQILKANTEPGDVILGNLQEGNLISHVAQRKNVIDTNFILAPNPIERVEDVNLIYTTYSDAIALDLIEKYNISAIYVSDRTKDVYKIKNLKYASSSVCFKSESRETFYYVEC